MFRPHLPEKYDGTTNPSEFLQVYVTAITAAGGNTVVMATYFHVALSGPAQTWLMNLTPGSVYSWEELCARFVANFASAYQQHGVEAHLHAVRQEPGETLRKFISASPRCEVRYLVFLMLLSSRPSDREYVMKKCWRSWPHMTWKLSPRSSLWPTSAPEQPRVVHGTQPRKLELPSRVARGPSSEMERRKKEGLRLPEATVHRSGGRSSDRRPGRPQQTPAAAERWQRFMPCAPERSPQRRGVSRDH
jgi:hypothetical protein